MRSLPGVRGAVVVGAFLLAGAVLSGCGGDDGDEGASTTSTTDARVPQSSPVSPAPETSGEGDAAGTDVATASGGAPAAAGADVDEPPGDPARRPLADFGETAIGITRPDGSVSGWCVLLALTVAQRQQGLMRVEDLGGYEGMLFVFDQDTESSFYMANTPMPLTIGWFDADGELVSTADMDPCLDQGGDCPTFPAEGPYRFALEVPQGQLDDLGVVPGSRLSVGGGCARRSPA